MENISYDLKWLNEELIFFYFYKKEEIMTNDENPFETDYTKDTFQEKWGRIREGKNRLKGDEVQEACEVQSFYRYLLLEKVK